MSKEPTYSFSAEKNALLKEERGVGFDDIIYCIDNGYVLDLIDHNTKKYPNQKIYVVEINDYAYAVPCVRNKDGIFLKTIYPSRILTAKYLRTGEKNEKTK